MTKARRLAPDLLLALALGCLCAGFALYLMHLGDTLVPRRNVYFNADTDRVWANIIDPRSDYLRLSVHPLFGWPCLVIQRLFGASADLRVIMSVWVAVQGLLFGSLLFAAVRAWGGPRLLAVAATLCGTSSAAFVFWAPVAETHMLAGATVLMVILIARPVVQDPILAVLRSGIMLMTGASVLLTNGMAWALAQLPLGGRPRGILRRVRQRVPFVAAGGLCGLGLLALAAAVQDFLLRNDTVPPLLRVWNETKFISAAKGGLLDSLAALALVGDRPFAWIVNGGLVLLLLWSPTRLGPERLFIALFALFGLCFHLIYDRPHAFLFAPDYVPAAIVAVSLALGSWRPHAAVVALAGAAAVLAAVNVPAYAAKRRSIAAESDSVTAYQDLRRDHPVGRGTLRQASRPIGADQ